MVYLQNTIDNDEVDILKNWNIWVYLNKNLFLIKFQKTDMVVSTCNQNI